MKIIKLEENTYELIRNENDGFNEEEIINRYTDYFNDFDYLVGDWAYSKLRLKGFMEKDNSKEYNNIEKVEEYIQNNCAYGCKWFVLKKLEK